MGNKISCAAHGELAIHCLSHSHQTLTLSFTGCDIFVDDKTVMTLVTDTKVKLKYQHLITNSFVEVSPTLLLPHVSLTRLLSRLSVQSIAAMVSKA